MLSAPSFMISLFRRQGCARVSLTSHHDLSSTGHSLNQKDNVTRRLARSPQNYIKWAGSPFHPPMSKVSASYRERHQPSLSQQGMQKQRLGSHPLLQDRLHEHSWKLEKKPSCFSSVENLAVPAPQVQGVLFSKRFPTRKNILRPPKTQRAPLRYPISVAVTVFRQRSSPPMEVFVSPLSATGMKMGGEPSLCSPFRSSRLCGGIEIRCSGRGCKASQ